MELVPEYPVLTARLALRPLSIADVDAMVGYRGLADVVRYVPFPPMTAERIMELLGGPLSRVSLTDEKQALTLGVERRSDGVLIGDVVLFFHSLEHAGGELGYIFHPDSGGHGLATEACAAMLALAFDQLGLHRVVARIDGRNEPSARLAARLGMRKEAHLVSNELFKGEWSDELVFAMLAREWPQSNAARLLGASG